MIFRKYKMAFKGKKYIHTYIHAYIHIYTYIYGHAHVIIDIY